MEFRFDGNQEHQIRAIESVVNLFTGQSKIKAGLVVPPGGSFASVPNQLDIDETVLTGNLHGVQRESGLDPDADLRCISCDIETFRGKKPVRFPNFSVEMETGTGKTYVYIRTALELFRRYGLRKYIVVVPSVAIREGVDKTVQVTGKHFRELYDNVPYRSYIYSSENLTLVRQFAMSSDIEIMVITLDSINKSSNIARQPTDRLMGETPIHMMQAVRPVLILDEPQNMQTELSVKALSSLDPLFALRYSATHRDPYNLVHRLTPYDAYREKLVKRVEVAGLEQDGETARVFMRLDEIKAEKRTFGANIVVHKLMRNGAIKEQEVTVKPGDSLESKTNRSEYRPFTVAEINKGSGYVRFTNGTVLRLGETQGAQKKSIFEAQIRYTIREHFLKQKEMRKHGIKVLSLFFIDKVDNYVREDGVIRNLFDKCFEEEKVKHPEWKPLRPEDVRVAYFSSRKTRAGEVVYEDTTPADSEKNKEAFDLIMRNKEKLLSFDEPSCFIFSHSALNEGWDNPNVFQICTLNQTISTIKKRQEIGRGVRLAVNQDGERVRDERVNVLTVIANESYERYVQAYQAEITEDFGSDGAAPKPPNARDRGVARLRKEYTLKPEFRELWERIKHKTRYSMKVNTTKLIEDVVADLDRVEIRKARLSISKARLEVERSGGFSSRLAGKDDFDFDREAMPNLVSVMADFMERTSPPMRLTRNTLLEIFKRTKNAQAALDNPYEFAAVAVQFIKHRLADQLIEGVRYEKIGEWYEMQQLEAEIKGFVKYLAPAQRSVYDYVPVDTAAENPRDSVEWKFIEGLESRDDVKMYLKLPGWFVVDTPVGTYNPDWAIVMEKRKHGRPTGEPLVYLVRETKETVDLNKLRADEARKIRCGERHFKGALGVDYRVVTSAGELP